MRTNYRWLNAFSVSEGRYYINPVPFFLLIIFPWRVPERKSLCGWMWIRARIEGGEKISQGSKNSVFEVLLSECFFGNKLHLLWKTSATQIHCLEWGRVMGRMFSSLTLVQQVEFMSVVLGRSPPWWYDYSTMIIIVSCNFNMHREYSTEASTNWSPGKVLMLHAQKKKVCKGLYL